MWIANMVRGIIDVWNGIMTQMIAILNQTPAEWSEGSWSIVGNIHEGLKGFAFGLLILFWAVSFFRHVEDIHKLTARELIGWFLRLILVYMVLSKSMEIMQMVMAIATKANTIVLQNVTLAPPQESVPPDLMQAIDTINLDFDNIGDFFTKIGAFFQAIPLSGLFLILLIATLICAVILVVTLFMRFFRLYAYTAIAPLPLSTFGGHATSEIGRHFLKAWASVCLEVVIISIFIAIFNAAVSDNSALFQFMDTTGQDANSVLWNGTINWMANMAIRMGLLVTAVKTASHFLEKALGV